MRKDIEPPEFRNPLEANLDGMYNGVRGFNGGGLRRTFATALGVSLLAAGLNGPASPTTSPSPDNAGNQTSTSGEVLLPETYDSVKDAYAGIQGGNQMEQGKCMTFFNWPSRIDGWVETVFDFLADHPEIHYVNGTGGWGGPSENYDKESYCFIMALPLEGDSAKNGGVLIYEAFGAYGPETKYVRFKGTHNGPIHPPSEK